MFIITRQKGTKKQRAEKTAKNKGKKKRKRNRDKEKDKNEDNINISNCDNKQQ